MDYSQIRLQARNSLKNNWAQAIAIALVAFLLGGLITGSSFLPQVSYRLNGEDMTLGEAIEALFTVSTTLGGTFLSLNALALAQFILGGTVQLGYATVLLKQQAGQEYEFRDLFSQFHRFGQGFAQNFLRGLYIFLWSLLFLIPGIIAQYRYAMTPYIMVDYPELTASEAIARSKEMMDGHKGELFMLHLTFIGWNLLAAVTMNIGHLVLNPYINAAEAAFYRKLCEYPKVTVE